MRKKVTAKSFDGEALLRPPPIPGVGAPAHVLEGAGVLAFIPEEDGDGDGDHVLGGCL